MVNVPDLNGQHSDASSGEVHASTLLPILQAGGFGASVDAFAWEPDPAASHPKMHLWLISLLGSQQAVKALWAQLIKGETATLSNTARSAHFCTLAPQGPRAWRFFRASLPAVSGYHGVLISDLALFTTERLEFLLVLRPTDDPAALHYRFVNRRVALPLHPSWADWLWQRALRTGEARALESYGMETYHCAPDEESLGSDLSVAVQGGSLQIVDEQAVGLGHAAAVTQSQELIPHGPS